MNVVVNAASAKMGGAVTYLTNLLGHLPPPESGDIFYVFLPPETAKKLKGLSGNVRLIPVGVGQAGWRKRLWWEQVTLRHCLARLHADALFSTANFGMFRCPVQQILLVRNHLYFSRVYINTLLPGHSLWFRLSFRLRRWLCCQSIRWADIVMTPTQAMLDDLRAYVDVSASKEMVNHYGVAEDVHRDTARPGTRGELSPIRLLYTSLYAEHKNLSTLLKALALLNRNGGPGFFLTTTANPAWEEARRTLTGNDDLALAEDAEVAPWVQFVGPLEGVGAEGIYQNSDIFVFASVSESFGFPLIEAMAYGLPIVASDTAVNREICGRAAVYFSPLSAEDLAAQVRRVVRDDALRRKLGTVGQRRASTGFRWTDHVRRVLERMQYVRNSGATVH